VVEVEEGTFRWKKNIQRCRS